MRTRQSRGTRKPHLTPTSAAADNTDLSELLDEPGRTGTLLVSIPVAAGTIGSTVAAVRRPGPSLVSGIQHFAAGVVIAARAGDPLPDLRHEGKPRLGCRRLCHRRRARALPGRLRTSARQPARVRPRRVPRESAAATVPIGLLVTVAIDLLIDGLLVGLGAQLGSTQAVIGR